MFDTSNFVSDLDPLHTLDIGKHAHVAEVVLSQLVGGQCGSVIGWESDKMVEHCGLLGGFLLEFLNPGISLPGEVGIVIAFSHQSSPEMFWNLKIWKNFWIKKKLERFHIVWKFWILEFWEVLKLVILEKIERWNFVKLIEVNFGEFSKFPKYFWNCFWFFGKVWIS